MRSAVTEVWEIEMQNYPPREPMPSWARYLCMGFGISNVAGGMLGSMLYHPPMQAELIDIGVPAFQVLGGILVGGAWFYFGYYGGLPLIDTVEEWRPPVNREEVTEPQREGLAVLRRRRWMMWASIPGYFIVMGSTMRWLMKSGQLGACFLLVGVAMAIIHFRYYLSRCPRCGFGFFAGSTKRYAILHRTTFCVECRLSLDGKNKP
jgi:hypothetical protein